MRGERGVQSRRERQARRQEENAPAAEAVPATGRRGALGAILGLFFLTGLAALLLETGWNRFFYVLSGTNVYSLSVVLAGFLSGIGLGSLLLKRWIDRIRDPLATVAWLYAAIGLGGVLVFRSAGLFERVYLGSFTTSDSYYGFEIQVYLVVFALVLAATLAMGANFPLVARIATPAAFGGPGGTGGAGRESRGLGAGRVFFANTLGAVLGAFLGEFFLLPRWGFSGLLLVTLGLYTLAAVIFLALADPARRLRPAIATAVLLAGAFALAPPITPFALPFHAVYYHGLRAGSWESFRDQVSAMEMVHRRQGFYGEVAVVKLEDDLILKHNGKSDASTNASDNYAQLLMGELPLLLHPHPRTVLNIGLGGGATLRTITHHPEVTRITQVEIDPLVTAAARTWFATFNDRALEDPRVEVVTNDGRNYIESTDRKWDVIISEPPNIWVSGVSGLFTTEFYRAVHGRLAPGGILCQWFPLHEMERDDFRIMLHTINTVFPNVAFWQVGTDVILLASPQPFQMELGPTVKRLRNPALARDFSALGLTMRLGGRAPERPRGAPRPGAGLPRQRADGRQRGRQAGAGVLDGAESLRVGEEREVGGGRSERAWSGPPTGRNLSSLGCQPQERPDVKTGVQVPKYRKGMPAPSGAWDVVGVYLGLTPQAG